MIFLRLNTNGFSTVTILIVSAIISFLGLVLVNSMKGIFQESLSVRLITQQVALESAILGVLRDSETYTPSEKANMQIKIPPTGKELKNSLGQLIATIGQVIYIRLDGSSCAATDFGHLDCRLSSEVNISCSDVPPSSVVCKAAYRLRGKLNGEERYVANLGVKSLDPFVPNDYDVAIPYDIYGGKQDESNCKADPISLGASSGFSRDSGKLKCIKKPQTPCQNGTVSKGIKYQTSTNSLEINCVPSTTLSCPANYALKSFNSSSLVQDGSVSSGTCVFMGKSSAPWVSTVGGKKINPSDPGTSISGRFCPDYYSVGSLPICEVIQSKSESKKCGECKCKCKGDPEVCETCGGETLEPVPGKCNMNVSGPYLDADLEIPDQPKCFCGPGQPTWEGLIWFIGLGTCQLAVPEEVPAL